MPTHVLGTRGDTANSLYSNNISQSTGVTRVHVSGAGSDTPTQARPSQLFTGDFTATPFLTLQAATDALAKDRRHRGVVSIAGATFVGASIVGFTGNTGLNLYDQSDSYLVDDALIIKGTYALQTLTTGNNSGTVGAGTTTQVIQKPAASANYTTNNLAGAFFLITGGGGVSLDPDVPAVYPIKSNTTTNFTLTRPAAGVDGTTTFQIVYPATKLTKSAIDGCLNLMGCTVPIKIIGIDFDDSLSTWAAMSRLSTKVTLLGCKIEDVGSYGLYAKSSNWVELDNCIVKLTPDGGFQASDCTYGFVRGVLSLGALVTTQRVNHVSIQGAFDLCATGAINIQDTQYAALDASIDNSTFTLPVDLRDIDHCFVSSLTGTNAGLAGQVAVNFGGSGQYYVNGATISTANANQFTIESANPTTWATLSGSYKTARAGNTVVTWNFSAESLLNQTNVYGIFNAMTDSNFGGKAIFYGYVYYPILTAQTAFASGGQASATTTGFNTTFFTTVAQPRASAKYPANLIIGGGEQLVFNDGNNVMDLYPTSGGYINNLAQNVPIQVPPRSLALGRAYDGATLKTFVLSGNFDPSYTFESYQDFVRAVSTDYTVFDINGGGTSNEVSETQTPGIARANTGVSSNGAGAFWGTYGLYVDSSVKATRIKARIRLSAQATVAQDYNAYFGITDSTDETGPGNGFYFFHSSADTSWIARTKSGATTSTDTNVAVSAGAWQVLEIEIQHDNGRAAFFIDGTLVATHTTNIPTGLELRWGQGITKTAGTNQINMDADYHYVINYLSR